MAEAREPVAHLAAAFVTLVELFQLFPLLVGQQGGEAGLEIVVQRLELGARLMGGDLTVTSVYWQGSTFTVRLPTKVSESTA